MEQWNELLLDGQEQVASKTLLIKRVDFYFDDYECQILNITDITAYIRLRKE